MTFIMDNEVNGQRVTWLLPVKNGMPYLPETLASIVAQTYQDFEVLAWDNGSTDGTIEELHRWIPARLPGRIVSDQPLNLGEARAKMVEMAQTELCACIDADDISPPERLEKQVAFLSDHPNVALVGTQFVRLDQNGETHGLVYPVPLEHEAIVCFLLHSNPIAQPAIMFRRSAILAAGNYRNVGPINIEDYDLWMRLAVHHRLANLSEPLLHYRMHANSTTQTAIAQNTLQQAVDTRFAEHAPALFGCSAADALALRQRTHTRAILPLGQMARHRAQAQGMTLKNYLRLGVFQEAARRMIAPRDVYSRLALAAQELGKTALWREIVHIGKDAARHTPLRKFYVGIKQRRSARNEAAVRQKWYQEQAAQGGIIAPSLTIKGSGRYAAYIQMGRDCALEPYVTIWIAEEEPGADPCLRLGDRVYVGPNTFLGAYQPIHIGSNTIIGAYSYIISANHRFERRDIPVRDQGFAGSPIVIEEDVWIGTHVVVLPGVTIGKGAIVAAGSVVNKNIPPYEIWGGAPARFLKNRP